ncbi:GlxA family transcriptional regulator [Cochlodiniinecator piscidefendens]|uniref:GlxA family transcriptional regulator n=1 Tax=Cochlodiniinecator piscidefendens TaxID=2715756 RepID=UPI00140DA742|nr:GlxA family transcriptional regulator [Cochlodiniinecator piscidefendens]
MSPKSSQHFEFLLFDGFSNMVLANALEPLRDVGLRLKQGEVSWSLSTIGGATVRSSSGIQVTPDSAFDEAAQPRNLVLVAGYQVRDLNKPELLARLRRAVRSANLVLALDAAPWILGAAGILDGHTATIHWQELDEFEEAFPQIHVSTARYVRSGRILSCGGASTALDMMLDLIGELFGIIAAFDASTMFVYDPLHQNEQGRGAQRLREKGSPKVLMALNVMAENIEVPLTTFELADRVSLSERTLNRTFMQELGITPGKYYKMFRLQRARYLAEETRLSSEQIALRCGFSSVSSLGRSFTKSFGLSIRDIRSVDTSLTGGQKLGRGFSKVAGRL